MQNRVVELCRPSASHRWMKCEGSIAYDILHGGDVVKNYTFMDEGQAAQTR